MVRHAHSSSLYSASPSSLKKQVQKGTDPDDDLSFMTYTEVGSSERTSVLKNADPDWAAWVPSQSDVGLMWEKNQWGPVWKEAHKLTDKEWTAGHGRNHQTWCGTALLKKRNGNTAGKTVFLSVCHLPRTCRTAASSTTTSRPPRGKTRCTAGTTTGT